MTKRERMANDLAFAQRSKVVQLRELSVRLRNLGKHAEIEEFDLSSIPPIMGELNEVTRVLTSLAGLQCRIFSIEDCIEIEEDKR